jgi:ketosteroid isomerase-like protein
MAPVTLEYELHKTVLATGTPYDNKLVSIAAIGNRKIVRWRDYLDSLAAWTALNKPAPGRHPKPFPNSAV